MGFEHLLEVREYAATSRVAFECPLCEVSVAAFLSVNAFRNWCDVQVAAFRALLDDVRLGDVLGFWAVEQGLGLPFPEEK